jgi:hypothetical protein
MHIEFWWGGLKEGDHLIDPDVDGKKWDGTLIGLN